MAYLDAAGLTRVWGKITAKLATKQDTISSSNKLNPDYITNTGDINYLPSRTDKTTWNAKQEALVSGTNIKTINNQSVLGSGNLAVSSAWGAITGTLSNQTDLQEALDDKQDVLTSSSELTVGSVTATTLKFIDSGTLVTTNVQTALAGKLDISSALTNAEIDAICV